MPVSPQPVGIVVLLFHSTVPVVFLGGGYEPDFLFHVPVGHEPVCPDHTGIFC